MSLHKVTYMLVFVGALNWGLIGFFGFNLVGYLFGSMAMVEKLVYMLVGVSALIEVMNHSSYCSDCAMPAEEIKKKKKK